MNIENERHRGYWLRMLMLILVLVPILSSVSTFGTALWSPQSQIVAKADLKNDATDNSNEPTNNQKSAWNEASATLSSTPDSGNLTVGSAGGVNAWGFMSNANTDIWSKSNNSSWAMSYQAVFIKHSGIPKSALTSYKDATTFAYALQATGLDQPTKSGFSNISPMQTGFGWLLQGSYYVLRFANAMFDVILSVLQDINPLHWIVQGAQSHSDIHLSSNQGNLIQYDGGTSTDGILNQDSNANSAVTNLSNAIVTYYGWFTSWGWFIMAAFLAAGLGMAALGINVGQSGGFVGQYKSLISVGATFLKRLFVFILVPIIAASLYDMAIGNLKGAFSSDNGSITDYAVYGAFVDYGDWVTHSRLQLPSSGYLSNGGIKASIVNGTTSTLTHKDIVAINYFGAGNDIHDLYNSLAQGQYTTDSSAELASKTSDLGPAPSSTLQGFDYDATPQGTDGNDETAIDLLNSWTNGSTMTAADYASVETPQIMSGNDKSSLATTLTQSTYNTNGGNSVSNGNSPRVSGGYNASVFSDDDIKPEATGGLSTLGLYTYMLTTASDNGLTIADTENLSNDVALPQHYTVNLVGTGMLSTGNAVWALGMMGGLAIIVLGYAWEILKSILQGIPAMTFATFQTAFGSLKGGVQLISVVVGMLLGTLGSAFLYRFAQIAFIDLAQFSDSVIQTGMNSMSSLNLFKAGHGQLGGLGTTSGITANTIAGAANMLYGGFLLFLAIMLLRYRSIIISSISATVEETFNKILATFGNVTGTGSAGTRGAISQNTNTGNTWGDNASSLIQSGGMAALMGGGAIGGLSALGKGSGKGSGKGAGMGGNNNANKLTANSKHANTSANKTGNAAQATGTGKGGGKDGNAAGALGKQNSESNGNALGQEGKGINASTHNPAGQGQGSQNGQGTNGAHGQGQDGKSAQGQDAKQNAGQSDGAEISGNGLNTNDGDIAQQNGDMTSLGGDKAQTNGQNEASSSKLGQQNSEKNNGVKTDSSNSQNSQYQNSDRDQSSMNGGLSGQGGQGQGQTGQGQKQGSKLGKHAAAAGAGAMAGALATQNDSSDNNADASSIGTDDGNSQLADAAGETAGQTLADASGMNGTSSSIGNASNNNMTNRTRTTTNTGNGASTGTNDNTNENVDNGSSDLGQQVGNGSIGSIGGSTSTGTGGSTDSTNENDQTVTSTLGDASSNQLQGGIGQTQTTTTNVNEQDTNSTGTGGDSTLLGAGGTNTIGAGTTSTIGDTTSTLGAVNGADATSGLSGQGQTTTQTGGQGTISQNGGQGQTLTQTGGGDTLQTADGGSSTLEAGGGSNTLTGTGDTTASPLGAVDNGNSSTLTGGNSTNGITSTDNGVTTTGDGASSTLAAVGDGGQGMTQTMSGGGGASIVQSQMGNVQSALTDAQQAQTLAEQSPDNSVLQQRATQASNTLSSVQGQALDAYNSQPVGAGSIQSGWMSADGGGGQSMTVGAANNAMDGVYQAQQGYTQAQQQYGANSPQAQGAKDQLVSAQQGAISSGLSSDVVSNPQQVESAHDAMTQTTNSLKDGTWQPDGNSVSGGLSQGSPSSNKSAKRSIGI